MKVIVGSKNLAKIRAVKEIFTDMTVVTKDVPSNVSAQPFSDEETRKGAINRAIKCLENESDDVLAIGLEGGVTYINQDMYLCNWGALVNINQDIYTASGARILLPQIISDQLREGLELGDIMATLTNNQKVRHYEGAIGTLTNHFVSRKEMFAHVVNILRGQWEFYR